MRFVIIGLILAGCSDETQLKDEVIVYSSNSKDNVLSDCKPPDTITNYWTLQYVNQNEFNYRIRVKSDNVDSILSFDYDCSFPTNIIPLYYWSDSNNLCLRSFCGLNCFNDQIINSSTGEIQTIRNAIGYSKEKDFVICVDEIDESRIILKSIYRIQKDKYYNLKTPLDCQTTIECLDSVYEGRDKFIIYQDSEILEITIK